MTPRILFLCVANSARSQMAEGLARHVFKDQIAVASAGSQPSRVSPFAVQVLAEIGIDISWHRAKSIDSVDFSEIDLVITLCADEICPIVPARINKLHWPFSDPGSPLVTDGVNLENFRKVRDQIKAKLEHFAQSLET